MNKSTRRRMQKVQQAFDTVQIPFTEIREALTTFRATGELPEDEVLGLLVLQQLQAGYDSTCNPFSELECQAAIRRAVEALSRVQDPLMDALYCEAIVGRGVVRVAARTVLRRFAALGLDPSEPLLAGKDVDVPAWGGVGIHLLGIPDMLAKPPYEEQARALFARCEALRELVPQGDDEWLVVFGDAVDALHERGELPEPGVLRDAVLVDVELTALMARAAGRDASEVMAVMDAVHQASGPDQEEALAHLVLLAREGRLRPRAPQEPVLDG